MARGRITPRLSGVASLQQANGSNEGEADHMISADFEEGHVHSNRSLGLDGLFFSIRRLQG